MHSTFVVLGLTLVGSAWLSLMLSGCGGPPMQQPGANGAWAPSQPPASIGERQLGPLLVKVSQLQMVSQESLDAATLIGTPEHELTVARQDYASAELLLHDGQAAYKAKQYELSWDRLRAADAAFRRAEETAVRAGLGQLEHELAADYGRLLNPDARSGRQIVGVARVSQGSINLRDGAGTHFQVIGKAQSGDTLTILADLGEWYRVRTGTGLVGWVSKMLVTRVRSP
jgi:Bacterial SH3 domain